MTGLLLPAVAGGRLSIRTQSKAVAGQHLKLEQTVEGYIRFHGNGRTEN